MLTEKKKLLKLPSIRQCLIIWKLFLPWSQLVPVQPMRQSQWYAFSGKSWHVPLFWHGLGLQGSISGSRIIVIILLVFSRRKIISEPVKWGVQFIFMNCADGTNTQGILSSKVPNNRSEIFNCEVSLTRNDNYSGGSRPWAKGREGKGVAGAFFFPWPTGLSSFWDFFTQNNEGRGIGSSARSATGLYGRTAESKTVK